MLLLSPPGYGGELCLYKGEPDHLWQRLDRGEAAAEASVHTVPFQTAGEVVLFQGRRPAHAVRALRGAETERLTLAVGLYAPGHTTRGLLPCEGAHGEDEQFWRVEGLRAQVLAALDRLRRLVAWVDDPARLPSAAEQLARLLVALKGAEQADTSGRS